MPSVEQVTGTLPPVFRERYPSTYAIIDGSEIFIETPSDLHIQPSTFLHGAAINTTILLNFLLLLLQMNVSFISPLYVGSIADVCWLNSRCSANLSIRIFSAIRTKRWDCNYG